MVVELDYKIGLRIGVVRVLVLALRNVSYGYVYTPRCIQGLH